MTFKRLKNRDSRQHYMHAWIFDMLKRDKVTWDRDSLLAQLPKTEQSIHGPDLVQAIDEVRQWISTDDIQAPQRASLFNDYRSALTRTAIKIQG